jgi:hypothetical protein
MTWLADWFQDPDHQVRVLMVVTLLLMWVLGEFVGAAREDYQGYWSAPDDDSD